MKRQRKILGGQEAKPTQEKRIKGGQQAQSNNAKKQEFPHMTVMERK